MIGDQDVRETEDSVQRREQFVRQRQADIGPQVGQLALRQFSNGLMFFEARIDGRQQLGHGKGLGKVIVSAQLHSLPHAGWIGHAGHQNDRDGSGGRVLPQGGQGAIPVHPFHPDVT